MEGFLSQRKPSILKFSSIKFYCPKYPEGLGDFGNFNNKFKISVQFSKRSDRLEVCLIDHHGEQGQEGLEAINIKENKTDIKPRI